ncbi:hypothetical protein BSNK01_05830 [Bacillaceae bacterium]
MQRRKILLILCFGLLASVLLPLGETAFAKRQSDLAAAIIKTGLRYKGVPYSFGAPMSAAPRVFDCSSFTKYVYGKFGIYLPRTSKAQARVGKYVPASQLRPADLVFFRVPGRGSGVGHVGIYVGNGKMLHTYGKGGVQISSINDYWKRQYVGARRVIR